ncbi:hypothetical protein D3C86_1832910 [compost metagenome]
MNCHWASTLQPLVVPQAAMATLSGRPKALPVKVELVCTVWTKLPICFLNSASDSRPDCWKYHSNDRS